MTDQNQPAPGWEFLLMWVLGSTLAWGLSLGIYTLVSQPFGADFSRLSTPDPAFFGVMTGALIGILQWLLLRFQGSFENMFWWIWASLFGWALGLALADLVTQPLESQPMATALLGAIAGTAIGSLSGFLLRQVGVPVGWWLGANILGFSLSWWPSFTWIGATGALRSGLAWPVWRWSSACQSGPRFNQAFEKPLARPKSSCHNGWILLADRGNRV